MVPDRCYTLEIAPLCRGLILALASKAGTQRLEPTTQRLTQALFDKLSQQPQEQIQLPVSDHSKIRRMVATMAREPAQWQTLRQWASVLAMNGRNLTRLVVKETGLSFRRWRHQLQLILVLQVLTGGRNVQQVVQILGYDSTTAFVTMFKRDLGQTPGRYLNGLATASQQSVRPGLPQ